MTIKELRNNTKVDGAAKRALAGHDASSELEDEGLIGIAGGSGERVCPKCGSTRIFYEPSNHCSMCADCDYMLI